MATLLPTRAATPKPETIDNTDTSLDAPADPSTGTGPRSLDRRIADRRASVTRAITGSTSAPVADPTSTRRDQLAAYQRLIVVGRWCSLLVSAIALVTVPGDRTSTNTLFFAAFAVLTTLRSFRPIRHWGFELGAATSIVTELSVAIVAVCLTGYWQSPLAFMLLPSILVGAFSQGGPLVVGYGTVTSLIVSFLELRYHPASTQENWRQSWQWSIQIVAFAIVAGLARKVVHDALVRQTSAVESMAQLTSANGLLFALHKVAQSLPSSLDLEDVAMSTIANARELFPSDAITILLRDETIGTWEVLRAEGVRLPVTLDPAELPTALTLASRSTGPVRLCDLPDEQRQTLLRGAQSGLYVPLRARQSSAGILAIERMEPGADTTQLAELLRRFAEPASIAIDNARWFGRIRRVAADEERVRIARDLHDRIGQSLAYVGFELDRLGKHPEAAPLEGELSRLRGDVRRVISEVRETLYDIRTDVNVDRDASATIEGFLDRVRERNPTLEVLFEQQTVRPLPARQEREMWLIAQEAIVNVERHARATVLRVRWYCNGTQAVVEVIDNGRGFAGAAGRVDSYGLRGLQERAAAIGARLEIESRPDQGTVVRCRLE
jgi:signal transduction histidine kinase